MRSPNDVAANPPRQLSRDELENLLPRLELVNQVLFTVHSDPTSIHTKDGLLCGLSEVVESVQLDIQRLINADAEFEERQAARGAR